MRWWQDFLAINREERKADMIPLAGGVYGAGGVGYGGKKNENKNRGATMSHEMLQVTLVFYNETKRVIE